MNKIHRPQRYERTDPWKQHPWVDDESQSTTAENAIICVIIAMCVIVLVSL